MSLHSAPLLYVFYETASLPQQRHLCEQILGLPVIENQFYPPHEYHGLVKYDAGQMILSLNLSNDHRFHDDESDAMILILGVDQQEIIRDRLSQDGYVLSPSSNRLFTDAYGHHYIFRSVMLTSPLAEKQVSPAVEELCLYVIDFVASLSFYQDILGLELLDRTEHTARFSTGTIDLVIEQNLMAPDKRAARYNAYLLVFYTANINETRASLVERGLARCPRVGTSDIGHTVRFKDPSGHTYCLYQPSEESLSWQSGPKVIEIVTNSIRARSRP